MLTTILIDRRGQGGKHADILDVCGRLATGDYHSGVNALAVMVRQSPLFVATMDEIMAERRSHESICEPC